MTSYFGDNVEHKVWGSAVDDVHAGVCLVVEEHVLDSVDSAWWVRSGVDVMNEAFFLDGTGSLLGILEDENWEVI